jgi:hypothetical protein
MASNLDNAPCPLCEGRAWITISTRNRDYERECYECGGSGVIEITVPDDGFVPACTKSAPVEAVERKAA